MRTLLLCYTSLPWLWNTFSPARCPARDADGRLHCYCGPWLGEGGEMTVMMDTMYMLCACV
jgi:hypothetical protein